MARARNDSDPEEATAARDFAMARLLATLASLKVATTSLEACADAYTDPSDDPKGEERGELMEAADEALGAASASLHQAMAAHASIDPTEGEPEDPDESPPPEPETPPRRRPWAKR